MPAKQRHLVVALIDGFYEKAKDEGENTTPWILNNVLELIKHVALENIQQLRGCYLTMKIDPTVLIDPDPNVEIEAAAAEAKRQQEGLICNYNFSWKPRVHVEAIEHETKRAADVSLLHAASEDAAYAYYRHTTNYVAQQHGARTRGRSFLVPSAYLDVEVMDDQRFLFQPTAADVLLGSILEDSIGQNAKKKIPTRRINFLSGNIACYSRSLNNPAALDQIINTNNLANYLAMISEYKEAAKDAAKEKKVNDDKAKADKKATDIAVINEQKAKVYDKVMEDVGKGIDHIYGLPKAQLKKLLRFYFLDRTPNQSKKNCKELVKMVINALEKRQMSSLSKSGIGAV
jgi:hypothetical protein